MCFSHFQSIEKEEPIEVDHAPTHAGLENGHSTGTTFSCRSGGREKSVVMSSVMMSSVMMSSVVV